MKIDAIIRKYRTLVPNRKKGVNVYRMGKTDLIRLIQKTEGNSSCYKGDFATSCSQSDCCWFKECKNKRK